MSGREPPRHRICTEIRACTEDGERLRLSPAPHRQIRQQRAGGQMCDEAVNTLIERIRRSVIGGDVVLDGPFGPRRLIYADYAASGRALSSIEDYIREHVLPLYANTHPVRRGICSSIRSLARGERASDHRARAVRRRVGRSRVVAGACLRGWDWDPFCGSLGGAAALGNRVNRIRTAIRTNTEDKVGSRSYRRRGRRSGCAKRKGAEDAGSRSDATRRPRRSFTARPRRRLQG